MSRDNNKKTYQEFILKRYSGNPIMSPCDMPLCGALFNPGQTDYNGKTILLVSVAPRSGHSDRSPLMTHVAESEDGIHFSINPKPFLDGIDCRVTKIGDTYYIVNPKPGMWGTCARLGKTTDFKSYEEVAIISLPDNRVPCLFPEKINGKFMRIDRPYRVGANNFHDEGNLWLSSSPDLIYWGDHRRLLRKGFAEWNGEKIGPTPPIKTAEGWLVIIHGVTRPSATGRRYCLGAVLLDLDDPEKIIGKTYSHILNPEEPYEMLGRALNTVFACGAIADEEKDTIRVYYGAADTHVGLAQGSLLELLDACKKEL